MYEDPGPGIETKQNKTKIVDAARCNQYLSSLNPSKATCRILYLLGAIKNTHKCQLHSAPTRRAQWDSVKEESREGPSREHSALSQPPPVLNSVLWNGMLSIGFEDSTNCEPNYLKAKQNIPLQTIHLYLYETYTGYFSCVYTLSNTAQLLATRRTKRSKFSRGN